VVTVRGPGIVADFLNWSLPLAKLERRVLHSAHLLRLSQDLPVVVEVVDTEERIERLLPIVDEMVDEGLVTLEKVRVIKYAAGKRGLDAKG